MVGVAMKTFCFELRVALPSHLILVELQSERCTAKWHERQPARVASHETNVSKPQLLAI